MNSEEFNKMDQLSEEGYLSPGAKAWLEDHLLYIKSKIIEEAQKVAKESRGEDTIQPLDVAEAAKLYAPGRQVTAQKETSFWHRVGDSITGITLVSAILAIVFGLLGYFTASQEGWLDIAKIFAGAVVGSAGAAMTSNMQSK